MVPWNSVSAGFAYIWQSKWLGIIAIKTEKTQIHFFSNVLVAVASLDLKVPIVKYNREIPSKDMASPSIRETMGFEIQTRGICTPHNS